MSHPLLEEGVKLREYQEAAVSVALEQDTLVVLPTGLGKTIIALFVAAHRLHKYPESKILFLAPTKPLAQQHVASFKKFLKLEEDEFVLLTGEEKPENRLKLWEKGRAIFATPQTIENELIQNNISLNDVSFIIFDEAHRAVGNYAYVFIAKKYKDSGSQPRSLALTASPGASKDKIQEIVQNLNIDAVEIRTEKDWDVRQYVEKMEVDWVKVQFPENFARLKKLLEGAMKEYFDWLRKGGYFVGKKFQGLGKRDILALQAQLRQEMLAGETRFKEISDVAALMKLFHAVELLETQGIAPLNEYLKRMQKQKSKAVSILLKRDDICSAIGLTELLNNQGVDHPKLAKLYDIVADQLDAKEKSKIIVFTQYRDTVDKIIDHLVKHDKILPVRFIGQATKGKQKGMSQKEQKQILEQFSGGEFNCLVATSVGEEGLDIPEVDLVVFYEPIPSEIRSIQRRGRTARRHAGRLVVLMTEKTRDEIYFWAAFHKERRMKAALKEVQKEFKGRTAPDGQSKLGAFVIEDKVEDNLENETKKEGEETEKTEMEPKILKVYVDQRERNSGIAKKLSELGVEVKIHQMEVGDYMVSEAVAIERKTVGDFLQSLIDKRLMEQMSNLSRNFEAPLLIIEGDNFSLYTERNIHPNAIRGAMASIAVNFGIPVIFTRDSDDTAAFLHILARREQDGSDKEVALRGSKRAMSMAEQQRFIIESLPNVSAVLAKRLLKHFDTVQKIFDAGSMQLQEVEGIGSKKAQEIKRVIRAKYEEEV